MSAQERRVEVMRACSALLCVLSPLLVDVLGADGCTAGLGPLSAESESYTLLG